MKKTILTSLLSLLLALVCVLGCLGLVSCGDTDTAASTTASNTGTENPSVTTETDVLWANAIYKTDKELGNGAKTIQVEIKAGDKSITLTLKTDKGILADALLEHNLVSGTTSAATGLYIDTANGIKADWSVDESWWKVTKNGVMTSGVSSTNIADGEHYELTRAIGY